MAKIIKKKIKIRWVPILFVIIALVGLCYLYTIVIDLPITNIYVKGNKILKDQEIIELAEISNYPSFLKTTSQTIRKKIQKSPYIEKVSVKRKLWGQVIIEVQEANPLLMNTEGKLVLSNLEEVDNDKKIIVPSLINYTPDSKYEELLKQLNKTEKTIQDQISEIQYEPTEQDKDRFALYMNDGNLVYLTLTKFNKISYYNTIINDFSCQKGILNLDSGNHFEIKENNCG